MKTVGHMPWNGPGSCYLDGDRMENEVDGNTLRPAQLSEDKLCSLIKGIYFLYATVPVQYYSSNSPTSF